MQLRTLLFVRPLGSGEVLCAPLADGSLASVADEDEAILEQKIALADHLGAADPDIVARFSFPEGTALRSPQVVVPREDLPKKLAMRTPLAIPTAVIPASPLHVSHPNPEEVRVRAEAWIVIIPLGYTGYVAIDERFPREGKTDAQLQTECAWRFDNAIDLRIRDEVKRLWLARGEGPGAYLQLLPARRSELTPVHLEIVRGEQGPEGRAAALRKKLHEKEKRARAVQILDSVARAVHLDRKRFAKDPPPLIGRERELSLLGNLLRPTKEGERQSVLLVGRERVGKSALLNAWIDGANEPIVYATSGAALIAGMSGLGQWQERVRRVMEAAAELSAVMWFDDLSDLFSERGRSSVDIPSALRPWMEQGKVTVVGELHEDQVDAAERKNVGFFASLSRLRVPPLDADRTREALRARMAWDRRHSPDAPQLEERAVEPLVDLADRYLSYESFPGKAIRLYDELRAMHLAVGTTSKKSIDVDEMFEATSLRTGVPSFLLREDHTLKLAEVFEQLRSRVVGQDEAVRRVAETICVVKAGLQPRGKPLATFLFVGPTGVGKTELARALADFLFANGNRDGGRIARFDMSEYMDALAADRLIRGSPDPSSGRGEGVLTRKIREQPFTVLLLDEIEKAHPLVYDLLLQVCGEGRLTDAAGRTAYFHNAIIIMTSNLGAAERRAAVGFERGSGTDASHYERAARNAFRPEFLNRIDRIVSFRDLGREHRNTLVTMAIDKVRMRRGLIEAGVSMHLSDAVVEALGERGYSPELGARALRRHVESELVAAISRVLAGHGSPEGIDVDVRTTAEPAIDAVYSEDLGDLRVSLVKRSETKPTHEYSAMREISEYRRELQRHQRLDRIVELREHARFLVAQLGYGKKDQARYGRDATDHGKLQAEHHRVTTLLSAMDEQTETVRTIEDLALDAYFRGLSISALGKEARVARWAFVTPLVAALIAQEQRRDELTLILQEIDDGKVLPAYLRGLVAIAESRGWQLDLHLDRGERDDVATWPKDRRWGPPRPYEELAAHLSSRDRPPTSVLLRVRGPDAILLALEGGRIWFSDGERPGNLFVTRLGPRTTFRDEDWAKLDPEQPSVFPERVRQPPNRILEDASGKTNVAQQRTVPVPPSKYWEWHREIELAHLLLIEEGKLDRDDQFRGRLPTDNDEIRTLLQTQGKIAAIKRYREVTGVGLKEAKDAVETMEESDD